MIHRYMIDFFCKELGWAIDYYRSVVMFFLYWCVKKCFIKQDYFWGSKKLVGKPCLNFRLFYWEVIKAYQLLKWQKLRSSSKQLERNYYCYDWFCFCMDHIAIVFLYTSLCPTPKINFTAIVSILCGRWILYHFSTISLRYIGQHH